MGMTKESMAMKSRMRKRTSVLEGGLIGMALVLVWLVWEVCKVGMRPGEYGRNLKGTGE